MDYLIELLTKEGIKMDRATLEDAARSMEFDPENLTKTQAETLFKFVVKTKASSALSNAQTSKPASKRASKRIDRKDAPETAGLSHIAQQVDAEMAAFEGALAEFTGQQIEARKQRIVETLQNAPVRLVQEVAAECAEFGGDPEFFCEAARGFCQGFSPLS